MLLALKWPQLRLVDPFSPLRAAWCRVQEIRAAIAGRRAIAMMDARMLSDIGLSRAEAVDEINRKPWDTTPRIR